MQMKTNSISQFNHTCEISDFSDPDLRASERGRIDFSNSSRALSLLVVIASNPRSSTRIKLISNCEHQKKNNDCIKRFKIYL